MARMYTTSSGTGDLDLVPIAGEAPYSGNNAVSYSIHTPLGAYEEGSASVVGSRLTARMVVTSSAANDLISVPQPPTGVVVYLSALVAPPGTASDGFIAGDNITLTENGDGTVTISADGSGLGDALVANPLSQFAATTSLQLKGVMTDETGSGALVFGTSPTITDAALVTPALGTPASGALTNCTSIPGPQIVGLIAVANLATGTPTGSKFIRDDGTLATPAGAGDVAKVGTPVNNQLGVWTGDGTIEGDSALTFDTSTDTLAIAATGNLSFGAVTILDDNAGTMTLSNIDALDATTEATIVAALDLDDVGAADAASVNTGTATDVAVTPDALSGSYAGTASFEFPFGYDENWTAESIPTAGDGKGGKFRVPPKMNGMNIVSARAVFETAGVTGTTDFQLRRVRSGSPVDMLSTKLTVDSAEATSATALTAAVINTSNDDLATDDLVCLDIDAVPTTPPQGAFVIVEARLP